MIPDENALLRRWISEGLGTERVSCTVLPEYERETGDGFKPSDGPWIVISCRGGNAQPEGAWVEPSMQVRVWAATPDAARERYLEVFELLHLGPTVDYTADGGGRVILCELQSVGQDLTDQDTGYPNVNSFFGVRIAL